MKFTYELKPCPFCGGEARLESNSRGYFGGESCKITFVTCTKCHARTAKFKLPDAEDLEGRRTARTLAVEYWNRRGNAEI